jgi:hypothetical protein
MENCSPIAISTIFFIGAAVGALITALYRSFVSERIKEEFQAQLYSLAIASSHNGPAREVNTVRRKTESDGEVPDFEAELTEAPPFIGIGPDEHNRHLRL